MAVLYVNCKRCDKKIKRTRAVKRYAPDWDGGKPWVWYLCGEHYKIINPIEAVYGGIKFIKPIMTEPPTGYVLGKSYLTPISFEYPPPNESK